MRGQANQGKNSISRIRCLEHARAIEQLEEEQPWISGQRKLQEPKVVGIIRERESWPCRAVPLGCLAGYLIVVGFFQKTRAGISFWPEQQRERERRLRGLREWRDCFLGTLRVCLIRGEPRAVCPAQNRGHEVGRQDAS